MPTIDIALVTWPRMTHRLEALKECHQRLVKHLSAPGYEIRYFCSGESLQVQREDQIRLKVYCRDNGIPLKWRYDTPNTGANMNHALKMCDGDFIIMCQDDMFLERDLDLAPICKFLDDNKDYALVRFDSTYTTFKGELQTLPDETKLLDVNMGGRYPYQDEPHIRRGDFAKTFGFYREGGGHGTASASINHFFQKNHGKWKIARTDPRYFTHGGIKSSMPERW
jgi:glycosyltransferase involved in cell wall biosynthesis